MNNKKIILNEYTRIIRHDNKINKILITNKIVLINGEIKINKITIIINNTKIIINNINNKSIDELINNNPLINNLLN